MNNRDLFIERAGTWMDVDTFDETVRERDEFRVCRNCRNWQTSIPTTLIACCDETNMATSYTFGCNRFSENDSMGKIKPKIICICGSSKFCDVAAVLMKIYSQSSTDEMASQIIKAEKQRDEKSP